MRRAHSPSVHEATLNWKQADQRAILARFFEHGKRKAASGEQPQVTLMHQEPLAQAYLIALLGNPKG